MRRRDSHGAHFALVVCLLTIATTTSSHHFHARGPKNGSGIERERAALLAFKAYVADPGDRLSSWRGGDCCRWGGLSCNSETGHVVKLQLRNGHDDRGYSNTSTALSGEINSSLLALTHLKYIDLSFNEFNGIGIPEFIASFKKLRCLNLSNAGFRGPIPSSYANLSSLRYLDLRGSSYATYSYSLAWLSGLPYLKYLDLSYVNLVAAADWLLSLNTLSSISVLRLQGCYLQAIPTSLPHVNLTALTTLDLSWNGINSTLPQWLGNLSNMVYLDLSWNSFHGPIPDPLGNLISLEVLRLGHNSFERSAVPATFGNMNELKVLDVHGLGMGVEITEFLQSLSPKALHRLTYLDLSHNLLRGQLPPALGNQLSQLTYLDLTGNSLEGVVTEATFANMSKLQALSLANNSLTIQVDDKWVPPFQLEYIVLAFCRLGPRFPTWLRGQHHVVTLYLESTGIADTIPDWFWLTCSSCSVINLSNNSIAGVLPKSLEFMAIEELHLGSNRLQGPMPRFPPTISTLDLSNNSFSGPLPPISTYRYLQLSVSTNRINGSIPASIFCGPDFLDLSNNELSEQLPHCSNKSDSGLYYLNLANNNLSGKVPSQICSLTSWFKTLILRNNSFSGVFPPSLKNCKALTFMDLGDNRFTGSIPPWISESFPKLESLRLRSNTFNGTIPPQLSLLKQLRVVDLAYNNLSDHIPESFGNFTAMASTLASPPAYTVLNQPSLNDIISFGSYQNLPVLTKGQELEYSKTGASLIKSIDLSHNDLSGEIPEQIGKLSGLKNLNLSGNHLMGNIPEGIGGLQSLESLD